MKKENITERDVIHCETIEEFNRILDIFKMDVEFMDWGFYKEDTVLYPFKKAFGEINGYCKRKGLNIVKSENIE